MEQKETMRSEQDLKALKNRIHRIQGQLSGVEKMLDENRYCEDILIQVAAIQAAMENLGYEILREHMNTCVVSQIQKGQRQDLDSLAALIRKLK